MHAQIRVSTTAKDTKSTQLARPVEADSKAVPYSCFPAGVLPWLVSGIVSWVERTCVLGSQGIEIQREGCHKIGQMDWLSSSPDWQLSFECGPWDWQRAAKGSWTEPCKASALVLSVVLVSGMIDRVYPPRNTCLHQPLMPFFHVNYTFMWTPWEAFSWSLALSPLKKS